jgi:hypothetical protein
VKNFVSVIMPAYNGEDSDKRNLLRMFLAADYSPFPAPHLRTNAFLIRRKVMLRLKTWDMSVKNDAYRFESGKQGMSNQILQMGLKVLVAGRNGRAYEPDAWPLSETLFQGDQHNLLLSDNHTRDYAAGNAFRRALLSRLAWGKQALPSVLSGLRKDLST